MQSSDCINTLDVNDLLEVLQSAYKELHSTETVLVRVHNDIMRAIDDEKSDSVFLVLLDLSSAFDIIDHHYHCIFLKELLGDRRALEWFTSYLSSRTQQVTIDGIKSAIHYFLYGVPQELVLGSILFCMYILNIGKIIGKHGFTFHIYADDI